MPRRRSRPSSCKAEFDAVLLTGGAEHQPRPAGARAASCDGVHFAMEFLPMQNKVVAGDKLKGQITATGKHVVVIGGGDTGSDCVGTSNRHGAASVTQFELMPMPPRGREPAADLALLADQAAHQLQPRRRLRARVRHRHQGIHRRHGKDKGKLTALQTVRVEWKDGKMVEVPGSEKDVPGRPGAAGHGLRQPGGHRCSRPSAWSATPRGNAKAATDSAAAYKTNVDKVFAAGDMRRGQSLVVWAIREGRQAARAVDQYLMGRSDLPN